MSDRRAAVRALITAYFRNDERARWFRIRNLEQIGGLPLLDDDWTCPLKPTDWLEIRDMRDTYNEEKPMTLVLQRLWIGSKRAGHDSRRCLGNGITHVLTVAKNQEFDPSRSRPQGGRQRERQVIQMGLLDANRIVETPPLRKHDRIDLGFYQDSSREEYSFSKNT